MKFMYNGPDSSISLNTGTKDRPQWQDVLLRHGAVVDLPERHEAVLTLQAQGYLMPNTDLTQTTADTAKAAPSKAKE